MMFLGVRFVLLGFDSIVEAKVRSKLLNGGGVDVGKYGPSCTHVIVDKLVYDDSVCVAARNDGKTLVTGLWVDHSFDIGMPADASSIMYKPLKDLNGIPGAKSLIICLTGYQRQDRDDIMKMVGLMGAHFSKPLIANKVTHLICYKFEGEKYELAKKMKKIKLVNHLWLEDCLTTWEILPEGNYNKSGYELEIMEVEAKDSEEEPEDVATKQFGERNVKGGPSNLQTGSPKGSELPMPIREMPKIQQNIAAPKGLLNIVKDNTNDRLLTTPKKGFRSDHALDLNDVNTGIEEFGCEDNSTYLGDAISGKLSIPFDKTPNINNVGSGLTSKTRSDKRSPLSDATKSSTLSYSRKTPRRSPVSTYSRETSSHVRGSPKLHLDEYKVKDGFDIFSLQLEQVEDKINSGGVHPPRDGGEVHHEEGHNGTLPQKRKADVSSISSRSPKKGSHDAKVCIYESPSVTTRPEGLEPKSLMIDGPQMISSSSVGLNGMNYAGKQPANLSTTKSSSFNKKSLTRGLSVSKSMTSEIKVADFTKENTSETSFEGLKQSNLSNDPDTGDVGISRSADLWASKTGEPQKQHQDDDVSSLNAKNLKIGKSPSSAKLGLHKGGGEKSLSRPLNKKMVAKKSLGSRTKLSTSNSSKHKGSIYLDKTAIPNEVTICSVKGKDGKELEKMVNVEMLEMDLPTLKTDVVMQEKAKRILNSGNEIENNTASMDDETEAPEDRDEEELEKAVSEEKPKVAEPTSTADVVMEEKSEGLLHSTNNTETSFLAMDDGAMPSGEGKGKVGAELEKTNSGEKTEIGELTFKAAAVTEEKAKGRKHPSSKTNKKGVSSFTEIGRSNKDKDGKEVENNINNKKTKTGKAKSMPRPAGKTESKTIAVNNIENSVEAEKENKPIGNGGQSVDSGKRGRAKVAVKSNKVPTKSNQMINGTDLDSVQVGGGSKTVSTEPVWFILSGHHLQRKEFQHVIRRLRGRFCRDSHHWSYQATHFIVPDPIRRTEKFFAGAASGRWILKTDYLVACNQVGRFLAEEPYEWYKNSLSEDGAIHLEAPRKWRLLKERTGHGAFYGMRIIIYGECIAPPLDTLKRAVKAGDGTILATSPPYTRFLKSGVDFAIVSPGMPRVDSWVQEFLRHEIPCVAADYLVEYICKPGCSLERHVLYKTNAWAEKSFANLLSRSEEIVEVSTPSDDNGGDDITCKVCGSRDKGEVMLICGDESGSVGCGVGTHIDCCDPPLDDVPNEDWFCSKCSKSRNSTNPPKKNK
ncbi:hypothetical protein HHK36_020859 [Tetracentron sinense]|uniref:BRCT domain-containing protein n=1 Tax=Tetracentron sinense TaxID=13715 RepID=A0A834YYE4_TETSI|nr:hypothetical protein HHK36_020859 [Tetracentron sinense]